MDRFDMSADEIVGESSSPKCVRCSSELGFDNVFTTECGGMKDTIPTGEYAWHTENKHFASVEQAIRLHIIPTMLLEGVDTASMEDYCKQGKELVDYLVEKLS
jgi:hypothetical protein